MKFDGQKLAEVIEAQGRSIRWLASRSGYHESTLSRMVNGSQPFTQQAAEAIAPHLGIPVEWLRAEEPAETAAAS